MLDPLIKQQIRDAYFKLVQEKSLSPRWGQRQMIAEIANALARIGAEDATAAPVCVVEAGTGTGKTIAYAVAAIPIARALGKTLVVATATIALQEQFVNKDLPDIRRHSGLEFDFVLAKGRRRYVCLSKLDKALDSGGQQQAIIPLYPDEFSPAAASEALPLYTEMLAALGRGEWDGDRDNWPREIPEDIWFGATTDHRQCSGRRCPNVGQCSFFRARDALQTTDVIVTNHDLVLSDLALGGGAILSVPEDTIYIFDEGHHLPDKALNHFSGFCRLGASREWAQECQKQLAQAAAQPGFAGFSSILTQSPVTLDEVVLCLNQVEQVLQALLEPEVLSGNFENQHYRLPHGRVPEALRIPSLNLARLFDKLVSDFQRLERGMEDAMDGELAQLDRGEAEGWFAVFGAMLSRAEANQQLWASYAVEEQADGAPVARWINVPNGAAQPGFDLRSSPILAADILQEFLWSRAAAVVATSATMTALNSFERFILHSGAPRSGIFKVVPSPFDYSKATLRVPYMACDPGDAAAHTQAIIEMLPDLLADDPGSLVLFSSRRQMAEVYDGLPGAFRKRLLLQGDYSKQEILRRHCERVDAGDCSVIFGLASFAEGVDLPGKYCSHVVIAKIPFAVPDSPLESALAEWVESQGRNAFMEISVPDAALRLLQACGRLLRTEQDTGKVTLLDRRVVTRRYGKAILDSLPPFNREVA